MADITRYPFVRHLRGTETTYVRHLRNGRTLHEGVAAAFWFRPLGAALSEVPVDDRELPLVFHAQTRDFQDVTVQATLTYRLADPVVAATRIDFSLHPESGQYRSAPMAQVATILTETAQQYALAVLAGATLAEAMTGGLVAVRDGVAAGLATDERLAATGISVIGTRVVAVRPEPDVEKSLQTPTRERLQADADAATFERRAVAVERERAIAENELQNQIELSRREEQLVTQRGVNGRRSAEEAAAADEISSRAEAERTRRLDEARAEGIRVVGAAEAETQAAHVTAYQGVPQGVLLALALKELAGNLPDVDSLVLTPDLLAPVLTRLAAGTEASAGTGGPR